MSTVTIKDIANKTKFSISTISRALNNPDSVTEKKRQAIFDAIDELGYVPNYFASNLKSKTSYNIGFIVNDVQNPFFNRLIKSIEKNLTDNQYRLFISFGLSDNSMIGSKIHNFLSNSVSGIMLSPNEYDAQTEKLLKQRGIYVLQLFTKQYDAFDSIVVDDFYGAYLAARRLLYSGHRRILMIGLQNAVLSVRVQGLKKAFEDFGLNATDENVFAVDDNEFLTDKICTKILDYHPSAVITISDVIGVCTIKALQKLSLSIPSDVSMVQYDDSHWADLLSITTIGHPIDILGRQIADVLKEGLARPDKKKIIHAKIDPIVLERNSVKDVKY